MNFRLPIMRRRGNPATESSAKDVVIATLGHSCVVVRGNVRLRQTHLTGPWRCRQHREKYSQRGPRHHHAASPASAAPHTRHHPQTRHCCHRPRHRRRCGLCAPPRHCSDATRGGSPGPKPTNVTPMPAPMPRMLTLTTTMRTVGVLRGCGPRTLPCLRAGRSSPGWSRQQERVADAQRGPGRGLHEWVSLCRRLQRHSRTVTQCMQSQPRAHTVGRS